MDVVLVRWPEEDARLRQLRASGAPRLLLLNGESAPPELSDCLEDWIRLPADDRDVRARVAILSSRAETDHPAPRVDDAGLLRHRGRWVALSPVEAALAVTLVDRFGAVVGRDTLARRAWPDGVPTRNALDVHVLRLRRRMAPLGLEIRTVRSRGYLMQASQPTADAQ
ncbi:MAG TPA: winged helix-turn-helix domain-containing protein [Acidimicrobiia bacterium]|nr:winged helix-turn-helix domain-containing protein [Acidimicrobiia bacterium]